MNDPLLNRLHPDGYEPMDIDKDQTISDYCIKYAIQSELLINSFSNPISKTITSPV